MRIGSQAIKLQAYSYQQTIETEHRYLEVMLNKTEEEERVKEKSLDLHDGSEVKSSSIEEDYSDGDEIANMTILELWLRIITGKHFRFYKKQNPLESDFRRLEMSGLRLRLLTVYEREEKETMSFMSSGTIETENGETFEFDLNLQFSRGYYEKNVEMISVGVNRLHDPLVINLDGLGAGFSQEKMRIDLNMDGKIDEFNRLNAGNGFLALDKNMNGQVDDGSELFGPKSGNGFNELRLYDKDQNNWIDENDSIFDHLKIWKIDEDGNESLIGLKEAGVGAIYLGSIGSEFNIKNGKDLIARITDSSIYIKENGVAAVIQQVDVNLEDS